MAFDFSGAMGPENPSTICLPSPYVHDQVSLSRNERGVAMYLSPTTAKRAGFLKGDKVSVTVEGQTLVMRSDPNGHTLSQNTPRNGVIYDLYAQIRYGDLGLTKPTKTTRKEQYDVHLVTSGYVSVDLTPDWFPPEPASSQQLFEDQAFDMADEVRTKHGKMLFADFEAGLMSAYLQGVEDAEKPLALKDASLADLLAEVRLRTEGLVE